MQYTSAFRARSAGGPVRRRLFCFPYAGAGAAAYQQWGDFLPADVQMVTAIYPGRESRVREPLLRNLTVLVQGLARDIQPWLDKPFLFFGHSMGAYVAFELARLIARQGHMPEQVAVSGARAPHCPRADQLHGLPPGEFLRALARLRGFPPEVMQSPDLIAYALPILRADLTACETHAFNLDGNGRFALNAYGGDDDAMVDPEHIHAWRGLATTQFSSRVFPGHHFYLRTHSRELLASILGATAEQAEVRP